MQVTLLCAYELFREVFDLAFSTPIPISLLVLGSTRSVSSLFYYIHFYIQMFKFKTDCTLIISIYSNNRNGTEHVRDNWWMRC